VITFGSFLCLCSKIHTDPFSSHLVKIGKGLTSLGSNFKELIGRRGERGVSIEVCIQITVDFLNLKA
jgi:hypothetical protein